MALLAALAFAAPVRADDAGLQQRIETRLGKLADAGQIQVQVANGAAVLSGFTTTVDAQRRAEKAARKETKAVDNQLRVVPVPREDADIRKVVSDAVLGYAYYGVFDSVGVGVDHGVVTLQGSVLEPWRKDDIDQRVARLDGVREVRNQIRVQPASPFDDRLRVQLYRRIYGDGLFERYAIDCVLDVGANMGQYGSELRRAGYRGRLLSFEPVPEPVARLRQAAAGDPAWTVHPIALGRQDGTAELHIARHDVFTSFREPAAFAAQRFNEAVEIARRERVPVRRLEGVLDELLGGGAAPRCFLKMDTQGYDLEVFAGLGRWAKAIVGLQSEVAAIPLYTGTPRMAEAIARYESAGFELTGLFPVSRDESTWRVIEFDCVMVRAGFLPHA